MSKLFKFDYYGLDCLLSSENKLFLDLVKLKFKNFKKNNTYKLLKQKIKINFYLKNFNIKNNYQVLANDIFKTNNKIIFKHNYLTTSCYIENNFDNNKNLLNINFYFKNNLFFKLTNLIFKNLKKQLMQNLIKLYLEQSLLFILTFKKNLKVLHAAAISKNKQVTILAGLNGVGKSTLAQNLIKNKNYKFYADNYLLIKKDQAYFSPDLIRLSEKSLKILNLKPNNYFGFNKYNLDLAKSKISKYKKLKIKNIYLITRADKKQKTKIKKNKILKKIINLQINNQEEIAFARLACFFDNFNLSLNSYPDCDYYDLQLAIF